MHAWIGISISLVALTISAATAWFTLFHRGRLLMTQPTSIFFGPDGSHFEGAESKIYLRTLLYSSSRRGQVVESMFVTIQRGETKQNFSIWVHGGRKNDLSRGSGLFVAHEGITLNHHFLLPPDGSTFSFLAGNYRLSVYAKLVGATSPMKLAEIPLVISESQAARMQKANTGLFYDWGPDQGSYFSHIDVRPPSNFDKALEMMANLNPDQGNGDA